MPQLRVPNQRERDNNFTRQILSFVCDCSFQVGGMSDSQRHEMIEELWALSDTVASSSLSPVEREHEIRDYAEKFLLKMNISPSHYSPEMLARKINDLFYS